MKQRAHILPAFALVFPTIWWTAEVIPPLFYRGWNHDPRFYQIYTPGLLLTQWVSERIGRWLSPGYAVVLQDITVALLVALPAAVLIARWRTWQRNRRLRTLVAVSSLTLPWFGVVRPWDNPQDYALAVFTLIASYFVCKQASSYEGAKLFEVAFTLRYPQR